MNLSKLAEKCKNCPDVETCDHKYMEAVAFLPGEPTMESLMASSAGLTGAVSNMRETMAVIDVNGVHSAYTDDIIKQINKQFCIPGQIYGGNNNE